MSYTFHQHLEWAAFHRRAAAQVMGDPLSKMGHVSDALLHIAHARGVRTGKIVLPPTWYAEQARRAARC